MNKITLKNKLLIWYSTLLAMVLLTVLVFAYSISGVIIKTNSSTALKQSVTNNLINIKMKNGVLDFSDIEFYHDGVHLSIYNQAGELIYGQIPSNFIEQVDLQLDNLTETKGEQAWYVYDNNIVIKDIGLVWVRGIIPKDYYQSVITEVLWVATIASPIIMLLALGGGYLITSKSLKPLTNITDMAADISDGDDLDVRLPITDARDEVNSLATTFNRMLARLKQSFIKEQQLTNDISHELRTPLAIISAEAEYGIDLAQTFEEAQESLTVINKNAQHMTSMINDLLFLARNQLELTKINTQLVDVNVEVQERIDYFKTLYPEIDFILNTQGVHELNTSRDSLIMILDNIIMNSCKYRNENPVIEINVSGDQTICITIRDNGIGISANDISHIFDRFYQVENSRSTKGLGLGLSLVKKQVELLKGEIEITSELNLWTEVKIVLPSIVF